MSKNSTFLTLLLLTISGLNASPSQVSAESDWRKIVKDLERGVVSTEKASHFAQNNYQVVKDFAVGRGTRDERWWALRILALADRPKAVHVLLDASRLDDPFISAGAFFGLMDMVKRTSNERVRQLVRQRNSEILQAGRSRSGLYMRAVRLAGELKDRGAAVHLNRSLASDRLTFNERLYIVEVLLKVVPDQVESTLQTEESRVLDYWQKLRSMSSVNSSGTAISHADN